MSCVGRVEVVLQLCTIEVVVLPSPGTGQRATGLQVPRNGASLRVLRCFLMIAVMHYSMSLGRGSWSWSYLEL